MSIFNRIVNWTVDREPKPTELNTEFNNVINTLNNLNSGTISWTNLKGTTITPGANIAMGGFILTGLGAGTANGQSIRYEQVNGFRILQSSMTKGNPNNSTTNTTFTNTSTAITLTPTNTSTKILIIATGSMSNSNPNSANCYGTITATTNGNLGSATLGLGSVLGSGTTIVYNFMTFIALDSPGTVSAQTYTVQIRSSSGAVTAGWGPEEVTISAFEIG